MLKNIVLKGEITMFKIFTVAFIVSLFWTASAWAAVTGDKPGLNGTTHIMAYDKDLNTYFKSSYDNWQYIEIDMENLVNLLSFRRYMSKDGSNISGTRPNQGESVSYSVDGVTWTELTKDTTRGWENYHNYGARNHAWQSVRYGWSDLLVINTPVTARYVRFSWDGNNDALHEIELNYDHILFDQISFIRDELMPKNANRQAHIYMDRMSYDANDPVAHVVVSFIGVPQVQNPDAEIHLRLMGSHTGTVTKVIPHSNSTPQNFQTFLDLALLSPGHYTLEAQIMSGGHPVQNTPLLTIAFTKTSVVPPAVSFPTDGIPLVVHEQTHVANASYPISTGIPFPDGVVSDVRRLALFENGVQVPAQFVVRSTWRPKGGFIRWLGLDFTAQYKDSPDEKGNFLPRNYCLKLLPQPSTSPKRNLIVPNNPDKITIDTGVIRFDVDKNHFAGIENVAYDINNDHDYQPTEEIASSADGGPFLVDQKSITYKASKGTSTVSIEEEGTQRVTIRISGSYANDQGKELCKFLTRISAFAKSPEIHVSHRTIIDYDTKGNPIRNLGWDQGFALTGKGAFGADGNEINGAYLVQEKADQFHVFDHAGSIIKTGTHSDGWVSFEKETALFPPVRGVPAPRVTFVLRDIYQKYPKELEVYKDGNMSHIVLHFWPKHGRTPFKDINEDTSENNIYKLRYAHQGKYMTLELPEEYKDKYFGYVPEDIGIKPNSDIVDGRIKITNAEGGQGVAIGNEFAIRFDPPSAPLQTIASHARLYQQNPHAIADPKWNASSGVLGRLSASNPNFDGALDKTLNAADPSYLRSIVEAGDEYGMWVYGDVHDTWNPSEDRPEIHRVWGGSHYQNVWAGWMRYFLNGKPEQWRWAQVNSSHYMDIATKNCETKFTVPGKNGAPLIQTNHEGEMSHAGILLPWGGRAFGFNEHFIDPGSHLLRYYLTGDRRGDELFKAWFNVFRDSGFVPWLWTYSFPMTKESLANSSFRDRVHSLGELVEYYRATWDPAALVLIAEHSRDMLNVPFEWTLAPREMPIWGQRWFAQLYDLTRDPRVVSRFISWVGAGPGFDDFAVNAFVYQATKDKTVLSRMIPLLYDTARVFYDNPGDRYHGYGTYMSAAQRRWLLGVPYFVQACKDAGIPLPIQRGTRRGTYPGYPTFLTENEIYLSGYAPRGWSSSSTIALVSTPETATIHVRLNVSGHADKSGQFWVLEPDNNPPPHNQQPGTSILPSPLHHASYNEGSKFPVGFDFTAEKDRLYRVEVRGQVSSPLAPYTDFTEAAVLLRERIDQNDATKVLLANDYFAVGGRQEYYFLPTRPYDGTITLHIEANNGNRDPKTAMPVYYCIETDTGDVRSQGSLFAYGSRKSVDVSLPMPPPGNGTPYRFYSTTNYGHRIQLMSGANELLLSTNLKHLSAIRNTITPGSTP